MRRRDRRGAGRGSRALGSSGSLGDPLCGRIVSNRERRGHAPLRRAQHAHASTRRRPGGAHTNTDRVRGGALFARPGGRAPAHRALRRGPPRGREHSTLSLQVTAMGGAIWLEPSVVVRYPWPKRNTLADYRFYLPRWSDAWAEPSFRRFNDTWQLTDTEIDNIFRQGTASGGSSNDPRRGTAFVGARVRWSFAPAWRPRPGRDAAGGRGMRTPASSCRAGARLHRGSWDTA